MNKHRIVSLALSLSVPLTALAAGAYPLVGADQRNSVTYNGPVVTVNSAAAEGAYPALPPLPPVVYPTAAPARLAAPADPAEDPHQRGLSLGGPRFGVSYLSGGGFDKLKAAVKDARPDATVDPAMSQFGWEVEYRLFRTDKGVTALSEFIPLVGGMDQGLALPSATWLVGLRSAHGFEAGVGPNFGLDGVAMMVGGGYTFDLGGINLPLNFAVGKGASQTNSYAISTGFNL
jgi:hypothetical protein